MPGFDSQAQALWVPTQAPFIHQTVPPLIANRICSMRFCAPRAATIKRISFLLTTAAGADDQCDLGIYSADGTALLGSSGPTSGKLNAGPSTMQTVTMQTPIPLAGGAVYYASFGTPATFGGTAAAVLGPMWTTPNQYRFAGGAMGQIELCADSPRLGVPLTAPIIATAGVGAQMPFLALLET